MIGPSLSTVAVIIVDDLLQTVGCAGEDGRDAHRDESNIRRFADDELGIVEAIAEQRDQEAELEHQHGKGKADAGATFQRAAGGQSCRWTI